MVEGSVTEYIRLAKQGDERADAEIWERYFTRLIGLARRKLGDLPRRAVDEEDLAISALRSLLMGIREDRFRQMENRDDLWQVLVMLTARKASNHRRAHLRLKRGAGKVAGESVWERPGDEGREGIAGVVGSEPSPEFAADLVDFLTLLFDGISDPTARTVLERRLAGYANHEIADELEVTERTVERKLALIRKRAARLLADQ